MHQNNQGFVSTLLQAYSPLGYQQKAESCTNDDAAERLRGAAHSLVSQSAIVADALRTHANVHVDHIGDGCIHTIPGTIHIV